MAESVLPPGIQSYLRAFAARRRRVALLRAGGQALVLGVAWTLGACLIDRLVTLPWAARLVLLVTGIAAVAVVLARPILRHLLCRPMDWVGTARLIELCEPRWAQRLETVTSRLFGPAQHQESRPMLQQIARQVEEELRGDEPARLMPARLVGRPWAAAAAMLLLLLALLPWRWLELPQLLARFVSPVSGAAPVTTTRLAVVEPAADGDCDVPEGQALRLVVEAHRLDGDVVRLHTSADGRNWSVVMMTPLAPDRFAFSLTARDRDLAYYVSGGDAVTRHRAIRVLRRPAVSEFRVRYSYPPYTGLKPLSVNNIDGLIEAPVGTEATVTIVATEPLETATLVIGQQRLAMQPGGADNMRQTMLTIPQGEEGYRVELRSARRVVGEASGPRLRIRSLPDHAPVVRLLQPGSDLRLHPRDVLTLHYQMMDDYGVSSLAVQVQINGVPQVLELPMPHDPRRDDGQCDVDLARLELKIGDVLTLALRAQDGAGQQAVSESRSVLISPRSIDLETHQRIAELRQACQLMTAMVRELEASIRALDELRGAGAGPGTPRYLELWQRLNQHASAASESAALLRQSLLRSIAHGASPQLSVMLARLIDSVQHDAAVAEEAMGALGDRLREEAARRRLATSLERAATALEQARTVCDGDQAAAVLADRDNLRALGEKAAPMDTAAAQRLAQTLDRARQDIAVAARQIGLDPARADLDDQLRSRLEKAQRLVAEQEPVDFAAAARTWTAALGTPACAELHFGRRLAAAAEAQAVRPDARLVEARDLQLAGWAADVIQTRLASRSSASFPAGSEPRTDFAPAMEALTREHKRDRLAAAGDRAAAEEQAVRAAAADARRKMAHWAGEADMLAAGVEDAVGGQQEQRRQAQQMALAAAAHSARREYDQAAELDRRLARWLPRLRMHPGDWSDEEWRQIGRALARARKIDELSEEQQALEAQTERATAESASQLAQRQHELAQGIDKVERQRRQGDRPSPSAPPSEAANAGQGDSRERALAAIQSAAAMLALMPQQLSQLQQAADEQRQAAIRAQAAQQTRALLPPEQRSVAVRMLGQAQKAWAEARQRTAQIGSPVAPEAAETLSTTLWPFVPETSAAVAVIDAQLVVALRQLQQAAEADDGAAVERAAAHARQAIAAAQEQLRRSQAALMEHDPLVAARVFAEAAARSLASLPASPQIAGQQQRDTAAALARAWDNSIHEAAARRLASLPGMQPIFAAASASGAAAGSPAVSPPLRQWGHLRPRQAGGLDNSPRETQPAPGYEDALRVYFQVLGQAQTPTRKGQRP